MTWAEDWARQRPARLRSPRALSTATWTTWVRRERYVNVVRLAVALIVAVSWAGAYLHHRGPQHHHRAGPSRRVRLLRERRGLDLFGDVAIRVEPDVGDELGQAVDGDLVPHVAGAEPAADMSLR